MMSLVSILSFPCGKRGPQKSPCFASRDFDHSSETWALHGQHAQATVRKPKCDLGETKSLVIEANYQYVKRSGSF
jgi:hypothetical protein